MEVTESEQLYRISPTKIRLLNDYVVCLRRRSCWELCVISVSQALGTTNTTGDDSDWGKISFNDAVLVSLQIHDPHGYTIRRTVKLLLCAPTWRKERGVSMYVLGDARHSYETVYRFMYKYQLDFDSDYANPTLDFKSTSQPPYVSSWISSTTPHSCSQSGRGVVARYNSEPVVYSFYPYSVHQMLNCRDDEELNSCQLALNNSPRMLHMEYYSGDIAFATLDSATVIILYYG